MTTESTLRFGVQTDEGTSLLRIINLVRSGEAITRPQLGKLTGLGRGDVRSEWIRQSRWESWLTVNSEPLPGAANLGSFDFALNRE